MPTLHIIHGYIGAGKTTFAKKLEHELNCIRFSSDEWICDIYGDNPPKEYFVDYKNRIMKKIWWLTEEILINGQDVIMDCGFWKLSSRDRARELAEYCNAGHKLYYVKCNEKTMKARALYRSEQMPSGELYVNESTYEDLKAIFEPISNESHQVIDTELE